MSNNFNEFLIENLKEIGFKVTPSFFNKLQDIEKLYKYISEITFQGHFTKEFNLKFNGLTFKNNNRKIGKGTMGDVYVYNNVDLGDVILKKNNSEKFHSETLYDSIIHSILHSYQEFVQYNFCPEIYYSVVCNTNISILMEKYDGNCYDLVNSINSTSLKFDFILEILYKMTQILLVLQNKFHFNHNDIKMNNILFMKPDSDVNGEIDLDDYTKYKFVLCDFGFSYLQFGNHTIKNPNNTIKSFNPQVDLYQFIHTLVAKNNVFNNNDLTEKLRKFTVEVLQDDTFLDHWENTYFIHNKCNKNIYNPINLIKVLHNYDEIRFNIYRTVELYKKLGLNVSELETDFKYSRHKIYVGKSKSIKTPLSKRTPLTRKTPVSKTFENLTPLIISKNKSLLYQGKFLTAPEKIKYKKKKKEIIDNTAFSTDNYKVKNSHVMSLATVNRSENDIKNIVIKEKEPEKIKFDDTRTRVPIKLKKEVVEEVIEPVNEKINYRESDFVLKPMNKKLIARASLEFHEENKVFEPIVEEPEPEPINIIKTGVINKQALNLRTVVDNDIEYKPLTEKKEEKRIPFKIKMMARDLSGARSLHDQMILPNKEKEEKEEVSILNETYSQQKHSMNGLIIQKNLRR